MFDLLKSPTENCRINLYFLKTLESVYKNLQDNDFTELLNAFKKLKQIIGEKEIDQSQLVQAEETWKTQLELAFDTLEPFDLKAKSNKDWAALNTQQRLKVILGYLCELYKIPDISGYEQYSKERVYRESPDVLIKMRRIIENPHRTYCMYEELKANFQLNQLLTLDVSNPINAAAQIYEVLNKNPQFITLEVSAKKIQVKTEQHFHLILKALENNKTITKLVNLSFKLTKENAKYLAGLLTANHTITSLSISVAPNDTKALQILADALEKNNHLQVINLNDELCSYRGIETSEFHEIKQTITKLLLRNNCPALTFIYESLSLIKENRSQITSDGLPLFKSSELNHFVQYYQKEIKTPHVDELGERTIYNNSSLTRLYNELFAQFLYDIGASLINNGKAYQLSPQQLVINESLQLKELVQGELDDQQKNNREQLLNLYNRHNRLSNIKNPSSIVIKVALDHLPAEFLLKLVKEQIRFIGGNNDDSYRILFPDGIQFLATYMFNITEDYILENSNRFSALKKNSKKTFISELLESMEGIPSFSQRCQDFSALLCILKSDYRGQMGPLFLMYQALEEGDMDAAKKRFEALSLSSHSHLLSAPDSIAKPLCAFLKQQDYSSKRVISHLQLRVHMADQEYEKAYAVFFDEHLQNSPYVKAIDLFGVVNYLLYADSKAASVNDVENLTGACHLLAKGYLYENNLECYQLLGQTLQNLDVLIDEKPRAVFSSEQTALQTKLADQFIKQLIHEFIQNTQNYLNGLKQLPLSVGTQFAEGSSSFFKSKLSKKEVQCLQGQKEWVETLLKVLTSTNTIQKLGLKLAQLHKTFPDSALFEELSPYVISLNDNQSDELIFDTFRVN